MKRLALCLVLAGATLDLRAQSSDAEFLQIYNLIQEGEALEKSGQFGSALDRFHQARQDLEVFANANPTWNRKIVHFRLGYLGAKLGSLREKMPAPAPASQPAPTSSQPRDAQYPADPLPYPGTSPATATASASLPNPDLPNALARLAAAENRANEAEARANQAIRRADEATARSNQLEDRTARMALDLRQALDRVDVLEASHKNLQRTRERLESQQATLQAKLAEALSPKPAALDPAELAKAQDRNRLLIKENSILKACLDQQMARHQHLVDAAKRAVEFEQQLLATRAELNVARQEAESLREERKQLHGLLADHARQSEQQISALHREIDSLRKDLAKARTSSPSDPESAEQIAALQKQLAEERAMSDQLRREHAAVLRHLDKVSTIRITPASLKMSEVPFEDLAVAAEAARARRWERERDELRRELNEARAALRERDPQGAEVRAQTLSRQVQELEARLQAFEAQAEPYSPEDFALFQEPIQRQHPPILFAQATAPSPSQAPVPTNTPAAPSGASAAPSTNAAPNPSAAVGAAGTTSRRRTAKDLPPGADALARNAERAFMSRQFPAAEEAYREILKLDQNNVFTLGNLAAILVEQGRIEDGEQVVNRALALDPEDPFCLSLLGIVRFRQQRYDEAFSALSRSAVLDPENADTQNYLGITLSQRGERKAAETALRKALKLNPNSAAAHYNLAVVYATQKPPFLELARFHYEKARRVGQPPNPAFEELLNAQPEGTTTP